MHIQDIQLHRADMAAFLKSDSEEEFIQKLSEEVVRITGLFQAIFGVDSRHAYSRQGHSGAGLNIMVFNAVRDHEQHSLFKAVKALVTPELTGAYREKFGDSASALYFQTERRAREFLDSLKPKKKKKEKPVPPVPPQPPSERMLRKMERDKDLLDAQLPFLQDMESGMTFERASEHGPFLTVREIKDLAGRIWASRQKARERLAAAEREFLSPPEAQTAQFSFTKKMGQDKGEKVFKYSRAKSPGTKRRGTAQT